MKHFGFESSIFISGPFGLHLFNKKLKKKNEDLLVGSAVFLVSCRYKTLRELGQTFAKCYKMSPFGCSKGLVGWKGRVKFNRLCGQKWYAFKSLVYLYCDQKEMWLVKATSFGDKIFYLGMWTRIHPKLTSWHWCRSWWTKNWRTQIGSLTFR